MGNLKLSNKERLQAIHDWLAEKGYKPSRSNLPIEELRARTRKSIQELKSLNESLKLKKAEGSL